VSRAPGADESIDRFGETDGDRQPHALTAPCRLQSQLMVEPMITLIADAVVGDRVRAF
jgi:hypothetical protein